MSAVAGGGAALARGGAVTRALARVARKAPLGWLAAALVALGLALHAPGIGGGELRHEEARRALPAREMLASGDFVVPTIWGRPYLAKPPGYAWSVAAASAALDGGRVTPLAVRLPALVAALALAVGVLLAARRSGGPVGAPLAAWAVLVAPELGAKASLGELETAFAALVFAATVALLSSIERGSAVRAVAAGLCCGAAALVKGPAAHAFVLLPAVAIALCEPGARRAALRALALAAPASLVLPLAWGSALAARVDAGDALATALAELGRGGTQGLAVFARDRGDLVLGVLAGWLPVSLALGAALATRGGRAALRAEPRTRRALIALATGLAVLAVWPGVRARYALPLLPLGALAAAPALAAAASGLGFAWAERVRRGLVAPAMVLGLAAPLVLVAVLGGSAMGERPLLELGPRSIAALLGAGALAAALLGVSRVAASPLDFDRLAASPLGADRIDRGSLRPGRLTAAPRGAAVRVVLALLVLSALAVVPVEHERRRAASRHARAAGAREVEAAAEGAPLAIDHWGAFNLLYELRRAPAWTERPAELAVGTVVVRGARAGPPADGWERAPVQGWSAGALARSPELGELALWRRVR